MSESIIAELEAAARVVMVNNQLQKMPRLCFRDGVPQEMISDFKYSHVPEKWFCLFTATAACDHKRTTTSGRTNHNDVPSNTNPICNLSGDF